MLSYWEGNGERSEAVPLDRIPRHLSGVPCQLFFSYKFAGRLSKGLTLSHNRPIMRE